MRLVFNIIALVFIFNNLAIAQDSLNINSASPKVYLKCEWNCDFDYVRNELKMIDFVRDRFLCDVQVITNSNYVGNGGSQNIFIFLGQGPLNHMSDTIIFFNDPTLTDDQERKKFVQYLKLGLVRYICHSSHEHKIVVEFESNKTNPAEKAKIDPWHYWQFQVSSNFYLSGDQNYFSRDLSSAIRANKETEKLRISSSLFNTNSQNIVKIDTERIVTKTDNQSLDFSYVNKLTEHWGAGFYSEVERNFFENIKFRARLNGRLEYSILPYKDFNTERIVVQYIVGPRYVSYIDTTIYDKVNEFLFQQSIGVISAYTKPWGEFGFGAFWSNYFHDFKKNNLNISTSLSWQIVKGLNFNTYFFYEFRRDQLSLLKRGASRDDVLARRRLIASSFNYYTSIGLSYRFGSIYNSQVNPTFKAY